jgi:hypothetical protein
MARTVPASKKNYSEIARKTIRQPGSQRMPRLLVYGRNKKGKTHFGNTAPDVLTIDPDDNPIAVKPLWPMDKWEDINDAYLYLRSGDHPYKWINMDGVTKIYHYALKFVMHQAEEMNITGQPVQVGKQHYGRANQKFQDMLDNFHSLRNMGIVFTAQEKMVPVAEMDSMEDDEDSTPVTYQYIVDLPKGARSAVNSIVDLTGRIYVVKASPEEPFIRKVRRNGEVITEEYTRQRRLLIGPDDMYETGYRSEHLLPDYIKNPTVAKVVRALQEGVIK